MTLVVSWQDSNSRKRRASGGLLRRLAVLPRLWAGSLARRRLVNSVRAETRDPDVLADLGIRAPKMSHVERWIMAMHCHQR